MLVPEGQNKTDQIHQSVLRYRNQIRVESAGFGRPISINDAVLPKAPELLSHPKNPEFQNRLNHYFKSNGYFHHPNSFLLKNRAKFLDTQSPPSENLDFLDGIVRSYSDRANPRVGIYRPTEQDLKYFKSLKTVVRETFLSAYSNDNLLDSHKLPNLQVSNYFVFHHPSKRMEPGKVFYSLVEMRNKDGKQLVYSLDLYSNGRLQCCDQGPALVEVFKTEKQFKENGRFSFRVLFTPNQFEADLTKITNQDLYKAWLSTELSGNFLFYQIIRFVFYNSKLPIDKSTSERLLDSLSIDLLKKADALDDNVIKLSFKDHTGANKEVVQRLRLFLPSGVVLLDNGKTR